LSKKGKIVLIVLACIAVVLIIFKNDLIIKPYHTYRANSVELERLDVSVTPEDYQFLDSIRKDVLLQNRVNKEHRAYVPAKITYNGQRIKVKMRLKGDQMDHYQTDPPSLRVKVKGEQTILGTNKFSIQSFSMRNCMPEWLYLKLLETNDILALKMDIIELNMNGKTSIYTTEEHFTHHLTDRYERPRGPIICISEDIFWENGKVNDSVNYSSEYDIYLKSPIKDFKYYAPLDPESYKQAKKLLNDYRSGKKSASDVFDIKKLATNYAVADLTNAHHALRWHNNRFYFNPLSKRLEPIGFDGSSWLDLSSFAFEDDRLNQFVLQKLLKDPNFKKEYFSELERISNTLYLDDFFKNQKEAVTLMENKIYKKNVFFSSDYQYLYDNALWIRENLSDYKKRLN
jgi:hypothetical protein